MASSTGAAMGDDYVNRDGVSAMGVFAPEYAQMPPAEWFDLVRTDAYDEPFDDRRIILERRLYGGDSAWTDARDGGSHGFYRGSRRSEERRQEAERRAEKRHPRHRQDCGWRGGRTASD